jgi:hypothetical protein
MLHLTTTKTCICGYSVPVCIHADSLPDRATVYTVCCPENGSKLQVRASELHPADTCPPGAVGAIRTSLSPRKPWWRFWSIH